LLSYKQVEKTEKNIPRVDYIKIPAHYILAFTPSREITHRDNGIIALEIRVLKKVTPVLKEKMDLEVRKTSARIKRFKEVNPDLHFEAFEKWLENNP